MEVAADDDDDYAQDQCIHWQNLQVHRKLMQRKQTAAAVLLLVVVRWEVDGNVDALQGEGLGEENDDDGSAAMSDMDCAEDGDLAD